MDSSSENERRHTIWVKWNDTENNAISISDLTTQQYVRLKNNDEELYNYVRTLKPNVEISILWRSIDDVDYTTVTTPDSSNSFNAEYQPTSAGSATGAIDNTKNPSQNSKGSTVWKYYKNKTKDSATCIICGNVLKHDGNTSNLRQHLDRKHKVIFGSQTTKPKKRHVEDENKASFSNKSKLDKEDIGRIDDCFNRVNSFKGGQNADKITRAIVYMITKDQRELSIVEDDGFKYLMKVATPLYSVPSRKVITNLLEHEYEKLLVPFKNRLKDVDYYSVTYDCWTDNTNQSYLGSTIHYITQGETQQLEMSHKFLGVIPLYENHTAEYLAEKIREMLVLYELDISKVSVVLSDSAANIKSAVISVFGPEKRLPCHAHLLALVIPDAMKNCPDLHKIVVKVKEIVTLVKRSTSVSDELKRLQVRDGKAENGILKVIQECETRWNATLYMIERFFILEEYLHSAIRKTKTTKLMPTCEEIKTLHDYVLIMKPLETASNEISGQSYPTAGLMIPLIHCLVSTIEKVIPETNLGEELKTQILKSIEARFKNFEFNHLLSVPMLLDPRFKKLHFENARAHVNTLTFVNNLLKQEKPKNKENEKQNVTDVTEKKISLWDHHEQLVESRIDSDDKTPDGLYVELKKYISEPVIPRSENPFEYWVSNKRVFPDLHKIGLRYCSLICSSVPCERLFSHSGNIKSLKRSRLSPKHLHQLLFLSDLSRKEWGF